MFMPLPNAGIASQSGFPCSQPKPLSKTVNVIERTESRGGCVLYNYSALALQNPKDRVLIDSLLRPLASSYTRLRVQGDYTRVFKEFMRDAVPFGEASMRFPRTGGLVAEGVQPRELVRR